MSQRNQRTARVVVRSMFGAVAILCIGTDGSTAQTQQPSGGTFQERFQFDQGRGTPGSSSQENAPASGAASPSGRQAPNVLEQLIAPPAAAEPAPPQGGSIRSEPAPRTRRAQPVEPATKTRHARPIEQAAKTRHARPVERTAKTRSAGRPIARGPAAFYEHPGRTASGETYNPDGLTAAHKTLPLGTRLRVVNLRTQRSVNVRINDRSPRKMRFVIDLSRGSARAIGMKDVGPVALYKLN